MRRTLALLSAAAAFAACHTITEDLPNRPTSIDLPGTVPVIVVPIPQLTPAPTPPAIPSPSSPLAPSPNPNPRPTANPGDGGGGGGGEAPTTNTAPVARLGASVYFVECGGGVVPGSGRSGTAPVGCRVHLDCTPKDSSNSPTIPRGTPRWTFSNTGILEIGSGNPFNPVITGKGAGCTDIFAEVDGVRSDSFSVCFQ
jgi:hypothetical protein